MSSLPITAEIIDACRAAGACDDGLDWISAEPRTLAELYEHNHGWAAWLALVESPVLGEPERAELHALLGYREWLRYGKLHRDDGPAVVHVNGYRAWWRDGQLHRTDGPAIERADGTCAWWIDGKQVSAPEASR